MTKWTANCRTIQEIREKFTVEQLLKTMPTDLKSVGGRAEANHCSRGWTVSGRLSTGPATGSQHIKHSGGTGGDTSLSPVRLGVTFGAQLPAEEHDDQ